MYRTASYESLQRRYDAMEHPDYYAEEEMPTWNAYIVGVSANGYSVREVVQMHEGDSNTRACKRLLSAWHQRRQGSGSLVLRDGSTGRRISVHEAERIVSEVTA